MSPGVMHLMSSEVAELDNRPDERSFEYDCCSQCDGRFDNLMR